MKGGTKIQVHKVHKNDYTEGTDFHYDKTKSIS